MNFKVSVVLLYFSTITVLIGPFAAKSFILSANADQSAELITTNNEFDGLKSTSILYGIANIASKHPQAANQCHRELKQIYDGIHRREMWAIKALDSSAMPIPGFVIGHNFWLGSIEGCKAVQQPPLLTVSNHFKRFTYDNLWSATAPFDIDYRMVYAEHRSPFQIQVEFSLEKNKILHVGLCLPRSCSNDEIANLTQEFFDSSALSAQMMHDYRPNVLQVKDLNPKTNLLDKWSFRLIGFCVSFTLLMMVIAHLRERSENNATVRTENPIDTRPETNGNAPSALFNDSTSIPRENCIKKIAPKKPFFDEIVKCFSLRRNIQTLISGKKPVNAIPIVDGLKSIGCFVIVVLHVFYFNHFTVHNATMTFSYAEQATWQWISTSPIIVDVFFTISGLLFTYNFLRNQSKLNEIKNNNLWQNVKLFVKQLVHRYIRLTPVYLVVIGCMECLTSRLMETSPFWMHDRNDLNCSKYWWRNLLYIQNLFELDEICVGWSWSLACEMQFTILSTILLFIYAKYPQAARKIFCLLVAICIGLLFSIAILTKFTFTFDVFHSLFNEMYVPPWTRALPYLVGVATGYLMYMLKGKLPLSEKTIKMIWIMAAIVATSCHLMPTKRDAPYILNAILLTITRVLYPASISWMILASHSAHGGHFAQFLNHPIFVHINKLSYGIYLVNPVVIRALYGWQNHSTHVSPISMIAMTTGINVFVYLTAIVFSLMFEIPYANITTIILKQSASRTMVKSSTQQTAPLMKAKMQ